MLHDELPAHQHDHAKQGRTQHQLGVAEGLEELPGQVGDDEPQKGDGSHHGGGHGDAEGHAQQQAANAAVIVHAQIDGLFLAQCQHIQQGQLFSQREDDAYQKDQGKDDDFGVDVTEADHQGIEQRVVLVGVHHPGQSGLDAAKEGGQHRANQQHVQHIMLCLFEYPAVDYCGGDTHEHHIHCKGQIGVGGHHAGRSKKEHHRCMDECIEGIHPQQAGSYDGVVDDGLEHDGRSANGEGRDQYDDELWGADLHGVGQKLGIRKVDIHQHISCRTKKNNRSQDQEFAPVSAHGSSVHWSAPPFRLGMAEQQPAPALPRRMALRPCLSR